jgi:hypothetical protein
MDVESSTASFEDIYQLDELTRWPVPVCPYVYVPEESNKMIKWGLGARGLYTTTGREVVADETKAVTVFFKRSGGLVDECGSRYLFPRWKMVLELSSVGPVDNSFFYEGVGWLLVRIPQPVLGPEGNKLAIIKF